MMNHRPSGDKLKRSDIEYGVLQEGPKHFMLCCWRKIISALHLAAWPRVFYSSAKLYRESPVLRNIADSAETCTAFGSHIRTPCLSHLFVSIQVERDQACLLIEVLNLNSRDERQDLGVPIQVRARPRSVPMTQPSSEKPIENTSGSQLLDYLNVISLPLNVRSDHWLYFSISFATNASSPAEPSADEFGTQSIYGLVDRREFYSRGKIFFIRLSHVSQLF